MSESLLPEVQHHRKHHNRILELEAALREIATLDRKTHHLLPALSIARSALSTTDTREAG